MLWVLKPILLLIFAEPQNFLNAKRIKSLAGVAGFEPTNDGVKVRCLTAWLYPISNKESFFNNSFLSNVIEIIRILFSKLFEKVLLVVGDGFEPPNPRERIYSPPRLATSLPLQVKICINKLKTFVYLRITSVATDVALKKF